MGSGASKPKTNRATQVNAGSRDSPTPPRIFVPSSANKNTSSIRRSSRSDRRDSNNQTKTHRDEKIGLLSQYENIWSEDGELSREFQQLQSTSTLQIEHLQKEVRNETMQSTHTATCQTAKVESMLATEVETVHHLKTSEKLDQVIERFKETNAVFDSVLKKRLDHITSETDLILTKIIQETEKSQQELLIQAKQQQTIEDEEYQKELQAFVARLDEKRAKNLALIHKQCQEQRLKILIESRAKIRYLHEQANRRKYQIMAEEESKTSEHVDQLVQEIETISADSSSQQLGTEIKTSIHLTVHESVGIPITMLQASDLQSNSDSNTIPTQK